MRKKTRAEMTMLYDREKIALGIDSAIKNHFCSYHTLFTRTICCITHRDELKGLVITSSGVSIFGGLDLSIKQAFTIGRVAAYLGDLI
jgi:hypothetical protein